MDSEETEKQRENDDDRDFVFLSYKGIQPQESESVDACHVFENFKFVLK